MVSLVISKKPGRGKGQRAGCLSYLPLFLLFPRFKGAKDYSFIHAIASRGRTIIEEEEEYIYKLGQLGLRSRIN